ncbi:sigma-70 family RNA polymerase sigma factor [Methylobacterium sp. A54F]
MTEALMQANPADRPESVREEVARALPSQLSPALRDYFEAARDVPLPRHLADLLLRFEQALAESGVDVAAAFRSDLVAALPALRTFALSLSGNVTRADDLVQETMAKAWANRMRFAAGSNFTAWLFTILRNQFYTELRKSRREVEDVDGAQAARLCREADQEHVAGLRSVMDLIGTLPVSQRQALLLVGAEGCTYEEAAQRLGCQVGTVKSRVSRARAFLTGALDAVPIRRAGLPA